MNRFFVIAGLVILVVALIFLNQGIQKSGRPDSNDAPPPAAQTAASAKPSAPPAAAPGSTPAATLPAEQTVGNPATAKHHIQVGWSYTGSNQQKPQTLTAPLQAIQTYVQQHPGTAAEIVNTDVPAADRSPAARSVSGNGVFVDGKPILNGDVSRVSPPMVLKAIQAATK